MEFFDLDLWIYVGFALYILFVIYVSDNQHTFDEVLTLIAYHKITFCFNILIFYRVLFKDMIMPNSNLIEAILIFFILYYFTVVIVGAFQLMNERNKKTETKSFFLS
jgi:hypothetical protein